MKTITPILALLSALTLTAFAADPKDELKAAAKKLAQQPNYSWSLRSKSQNGAGGPGADSDGKIEKIQNREDLKIEVGTIEGAGGQALQ